MSLHPRILLKSGVKSDLHLSFAVVLLLGLFGCGNEAKKDARRIQAWGNRFAAEHEKDKDVKWVETQTECMQRAIEEHNRRFSIKMDSLSQLNSKTASKALCPGLK